MYLCVGLQVLKAIVQVTTSGTLAVWWFQPKRLAAVRGSLFRAMTTSFGSICFGSLIVAVIHALRDMLQYIKNQSQRRRGGQRGNENVVLAIVVCIIDFLLRIIEQILEYFNKYAFCYVAAYGTGFVRSV